MDVQSQHIFVDSLRRQKGTSSYQTTGTVVRVDDDDIYVRFSGAETDTCIESSSVAVSAGDVVDIFVSNYDTHITGNRTSRATDDSTANHAVGMADTARQTSEYAKREAETANSAASAAAVAAAIADAAAQAAQTDANTANQSAQLAFQEAESAKSSADAAFESADAALSSAVEARSEASNASLAALDAGRAASIAQAAIGTEAIEWHDYVVIRSQDGYHVWDKSIPESERTESNETDISRITAIYQDSLGLHLLGASIDGESQYRADIDGSGMDITDSTDGETVASFGPETQVGKTSSGHFVISAEKLQGWFADKQYFEVSQEGIKYGENLSIEPVPKSDFNSFSDSLVGFEDEEGTFIPGRIDKVDDSIEAINETLEDCRVVKETLEVYKHHVRLNEEKGGEVSVVAESPNSSSNPKVQLRVRTDSIRVFENSEGFVEFTENEMAASNVSVSKYLKLGNWALFSRENGNLTLKWMN